jgi:hypothetical protein
MGRAGWRCCKAASVWRAHLQRREQPRGFGTVAGPQVDQHRRRRQHPGHVGDACVENAGLGAGGVVLAQFGDGVKEARPQPVVEEFRLGACRRGQQALGQLGTEGLGVGPMELQETGGV